MAQQLDRARRLALADEVIHNDVDLDALRAQVEKLHASLIGR
jgi:dephospho-CoA kinase